MSTSGPSRRRRAPPNPYSLADQRESLALFLAARNLPVPSILKRPAQEKDRSSHSKKRRKRVEHKNNPGNDINSECGRSESSAFPPPIQVSPPERHQSPPPHQQQPGPSDGVPTGPRSSDNDAVVGPGLSHPSNAAATPLGPTGTIPVSSATAASPERENLASTLNGSFASAPPASTGNTEATGQPQAPVKRARGLAVMGTGLTDKNFCMKDWLRENPNGSKAAFEKYFKALSADVKKIYKDQANAAKAARKGKKTDMDAKQPGTQESQVA